MSDLYIDFKGNLGDDAKFGATKTGVTYTNFRVAVTPRKQDDSGNWVDGETKWVNVTAWRNLADRAAGLKKGQQVAVKGKLSLSEYEKDGEKRASLSVDASEINMALPFVKNGESAPVSAPAATQSDSDDLETAIF